MTELNAADWEQFLGRFPQAHLLQTAAWGELKTAFGWKARRVAVGENGAQVLFRRLPLGFSLAYLPKGPVGSNWQALWPEIDRLCRRERAVFLKLEPDCWEEDAAGLPSRLPGFRPSPHSIQPPRTVVIDLTGSEEDVLGRMKQKTRYNIRLAQKKDVVVEPSEDVASFARLMQVTGERDRFGTHSFEYYQKAFNLFHPTGAVELLMARYNRQDLAGLMVFRRGTRAWYLYGASGEAERNRMPTYLLQWEAMRWAREHGCTEYDLWGVPDVPEAELEAQFEKRSDGLWGVYRFKRGFGGQVKRAAAAWERPYQPLLYQLYLRWLNRRPVTA